jgi:hypothetical protein
MSKLNKLLSQLSGDEIEEAVNPNRLPSEFWVRQSEFDKVMKAAGIWNPGRRRVGIVRLKPPADHFWKVANISEPQLLVGPRGTEKVFKVSIKQIDPHQVSPE